MKNKDKFQAELTTLINVHSLENGSDTPDFVLAEYLVSCLESYEKVIEDKKYWNPKGE